MPWWRVSTNNKKSVEEHMLFIKDDMVIRYITGYRWGSVMINTEESESPPVILQLDGPTGDGVDMYNTSYEYDLDHLSDGWFTEIIFPDDMSSEEQEELQEVIDEDVFELEQQGWINYETECWFYGDLDIVRLEE